MSVDVENISINVKTDAGNAAKQFKTLSGAMDGVAQAAGKVEASTQTVSTEVGNATKKTKALSDKLQDTIKNATKYQVLVHKSAVAETKMEKAFRSGKENAAWAARERAINATAAAAREYEKNQPKTPLSKDDRQLISTATQADLLRAKLDSLDAAMKRAFGEGNASKARQYREQIIRTQSAIDRLTTATKKQTKSAKVVTPLAEDQQQLIATASQIDLLQMKLESLNAAMKRAFNEGDANKAVAYRAQILQTQAAIDRLTKSTDEMASGTKKAAKAAKSATGIFGKFARSLLRIAGYRLLRTIIKSITSAFSEGLKNAYNFSKGISGTLAAALDTISTKSLTMKNQLGAALGGLLTAITPILLRIIELVRAAAQALSALFSALGGGQYLVATDVAQSWDKATGAAKKYKNTILGFDEINRLDEPSGGGGGSAVDASKMFEVGELPGWAQSVANVFESIRGKIREFIDQLNFEPINKSLGELWQSVSRLADTIGRALGWAWNNILVPLGKWTIEEAAPRVVEALASAFDFLDSVLNALAPVLEPLWENVLRPFFEWLGNIVLTGLDGLIDLLKDLTKLINGEISFKEFVQGLDDVKIALLALGGIAILSGIGNLGTGIASAFTTAVGAARTGVAKLETALLNGAKWVAVGALAVADAVLVAYDFQTLNEANQAYSEALSAHGNEINNALRLYKQLYDEKGKEVADSWAAMVYQVDTTGMTLDESQKALCQKIDSYWDDVPQDLWEGFVSGWNYYFGPGGTKLDGLLVDAFNNAVSGVKKLLGIQSPSTVFYDIGDNMVQGLWNGFKEKWDSFITEVQGWWRSLKTWWGGLSLGNITGGVSIAAASSSPHFSGAFASGGAIENTGSLFLAGEAGPEIVANMGSKTGVMNVDQMEAAVANGNSAVVGAVYAMANAIVSAIESKDTDIRIDGESLARRLYKPMRDVSNQRGASLVMA